MSVELSFSAAPIAVRRPRVWTVFTTFALVFIITIVSQVVVVVGFVVWLVSQGEPVEQVAKGLPELVASPPWFLGLLAMSQAIIGGGAIVAAYWSPQPFRERLGLRCPNLPAWGYPVIIVGAFLPTAIGLALAYALALVLPPDPTLDLIYELMTPAWAVVFVLFIACGPGLMEELLFRGYMQRRLLERWSPATAIGVTTVLFGLMHVMPHAILAASFIGLWLGIIAWRTDSVWPGVICHAAVNGLWNVRAMMHRFAGWPEWPPVWLAVVLGVLVSACFVLSIWLLFARSPHAAKTA